MHITTLRNSNVSLMKRVILHVLLETYLTSHLYGPIEGHGDDIILAASLRAKRFILTVIAPNSTRFQVREVPQLHPILAH